MKQSDKSLILAFIFIVVTRLFIFFNPPSNYSDVFQDYRRYASMWASGLTPYLIHLYEYPPLTIPPLYIPELLNRANIGHYYENYRLEILVLDLLISWLLLRFILKNKTSKRVKTTAVVWLGLAPVIAKDFFYEGIDWIFIGSYSLALIYWSRRYLFWWLFWMSTGIKLLTAPLWLVFIRLSKFEWKPLIIGGALVWLVPLVIFRSSLSVMWTYNNARAIKYAAFPSFIVETINNFTHSETRRNEPPDFELLGPISNKANQAVKIVFPLSVLAVIVYGREHKLGESFAGGVKISLVYFLTIFFTAKIFSQPFHLWYVPLLAIYPFKSATMQAKMLGIAALLLIVDTTPWIKVNEQLMIIDPLPLKFFSYLLLRYLPLAGLLWYSIKLPSR